eukprot:4296845-Pleurochrysis_carterae.AAC.2
MAMRSSFCIRTAGSIACGSSRAEALAQSATALKHAWPSRRFVHSITLVRVPSCVLAVDLQRIVFTQGLERIARVNGARAFRWVSDKRDCWRDVAFCL